MNWQELNENIRMGRECALLGQYDTALVYYDSCLATISRIITSGRDTSKQQRWVSVISRFYLYILYYFCLKNWLEFG